MGDKVLIVGGVAGGATAAARLRRLNEDAEIIVFEKDEYISFANCGLPYHIGGVIPQRKKLVLQSPGRFKSRFNVDVRIKNEVIKIEPDNKRVEVKDHNTGERYFESYDNLILSPGARPARPGIPGIDSERIFTLRNIPDTDAINSHITNAEPKKAVVIGAGYIGLEMAENLSKRGIQVAVVEMLEQVLPNMDSEMAGFVRQCLTENNIALWLGDAVAGFKKDNGELKVELKSGEQLGCDFAVLSIGVRPEVKLAREAGLKTGSRGGIKVNEYLQTNEPDIYAIGDAIEVKDYVLGVDTLIPLAGPANKQGRIAADNIAGRKVKYEGAVGTSVLKVFDKTVAMTGANEKQLNEQGIDYEKVYVHPPSHATYYPGAHMMHIKLLFSRAEGRVLGVQIVGIDGVDKRIDVFATAVRFGLSVFDLQKLDLAYSPPYGNAKDPVNIAGCAASNILEGIVDAKNFDEMSGDEIVVDVRTPGEYEREKIPGARNMYVDEIRGRLKELPRNKEIDVYCAVGYRSYIASRILSQNGFSAKNLSGGINSYKAFSLQGGDEEAGKELKEKFLKESPAESEYTEGERVLEE